VHLHKENPYKDSDSSTTNYLHGYPQYCVSIALSVRGALTLGVIYDPCRNDLFTACRGSGAFLNDRRIRVGKRTMLADCLVATGHPHVNTEKLDLDMAQLKAMIQRTVGVRREGSAALDLAYVACGRTDGYWEMNLNPWDIAAGALLVQEAGGIVTDLDGNENWLESGDILAANPKIMHQMLQVLNQA
jgi:myo-inositol-1(or 4)-monophosphatase